MTEIELVTNVSIKCITFSNFGCSTCHMADTLDWIWLHNYLLMINAMASFVDDASLLMAGTNTGSFSQFNILAINILYRFNVRLALNRIGWSNDKFDGEKKLKLCTKSGQIHIHVGYHSILMAFGMDSKLNSLIFKAFPCFSLLDNWRFLIWCCYISIQLVNSIPIQNN